VWHDPAVPATDQPLPFVVAIPEDDLADLHRRLAHVRLPPASGWPAWDGGVSRDYLASLIETWRFEFDWRAQEARINEFDHFRVAIDDLPIHFLRRRGVGPAPMPLILIHGWPWTFWDFRALIEPLADPGALGHDPADAFDVVIPSLPGYAFSNPLPGAAIPAWKVADLWVTLMCDVLGYERFAVHGGDMGALVAAQLGHRYAERLVGLHIAPRPLRLDTFNVDRPWMLFGDLGQTPDELAWVTKKIGHVVVHTLSPETLSIALHDSPAGMAAWLLERRRNWSDSSGDLESVFSREDLLTNFSLFWLTDSLAPSVRQYRANWMTPWTPSHLRAPVVEAPTGVTLFVRDAPPNASNEWLAEYFNLRFCEVAEPGGHFAAAERPELIVDHLRMFYRPFRGR
jgi:pimeloyl-ACP methyl ester carboxylesterase